MTKKKIIKERDELARNNLQLKNKQSMIEYKLREYKEKNGNPYTGDPNKDLKVKEDYSGVMGALKKLSNSIQKILDGKTEEGYAEMNSTIDMFSDS